MIQVYHVVDADGSCWRRGRSYTASVREDVDIGSPLLRLSAADQDAGDNGRVQFILCDQSTNSSTSELAAVDADTGWLSTAAALDYETVQQVSLSPENLTISRQLWLLREREAIIFLGIFSLQALSPTPVSGHFRNFPKRYGFSSNGSFATPILKAPQ